MTTMTTRGLFIGGKWHDARNRAVRTIFDPASGEEVGRTAVADAVDVDLAVAAALEVQPVWADTHPDERGSILHRAAYLIEARMEEIAARLTQEQGKPLPDSRKEILFGAEVLRYYAEEARRVGGSVRPSAQPDVKSLVSYSPVGVVGGIVPWNYPVDLYCWKVAPALAAGCSIVVKPAVETPFAVGIVVECLHDAGVPPGVLADLPGDLPAGQRLTEHPDVRMITATCSTRTGSAIMASAAGTLKRLSLELGGQCPFVVLDDADIAEAAAAAARRSFSNMGQICISVNRVLVQDAVADEFVDALAGIADGIRLGNGTEPGVLYGPLLNDAVRQRSAEHVREAIGRGAQLVSGGHAPTGAEYEHGAFYRPTVLDHVSPASRVMNEETFGPVVAVHRARDDQQVLELANATSFGLAAYVYSGDLERAWAMADRIESGAVGINVNDVTELQAPFGGWKMSGFGRELGPEGLHTYLQPRHVRIRVRGLR